MPDDFPFSALIACAAREVEKRRRAYPRRVANGYMSQELADLEIAKMEAIVEKLRELSWRK
ncbi:MAG TPA: hypothetical protein VGF29_05835 [Hyphomicrobiaceae bacterium]|jgi:hypothetical protein